MKTPQLEALRVALFTLSAAALVMLPAMWCQAQVTVWVDFTSDMHSGGPGSSPNGIADWVDELGKATASAGVTLFSPAERSAIEADILSQLGAIVDPMATDYYWLMVGVQSVPSPRRSDCSSLARRRCVS